MKKLWNSLRNFKVTVFFLLFSHLNYLSGNRCITSLLYDQTGSLRARDHVYSIITVSPNTHSFIHSLLNTDLELLLSSRYCPGTREIALNTDVTGPDCALRGSGSAALCVDSGERSRAGGQGATLQVRGEGGYDAKCLVEVVNRRSLYRASCEG